MHGTFALSDTNPNDTTGGGGCVCSETHDPDTRGPYIVCYAVEADSGVSPHVVVCAECLKEMQALVDKQETVRIGYEGDRPHVSNPYANDAKQDQGDEVLNARRIRANNLKSDSTSNDPDTDSDDDLDI